MKHSEGESQNKKAILVISFGTSYPDTCKATIGAIEAAIIKAFPEYEIFRAFTSQMILDKIKERDGIVFDNVAQALERLSKAGYNTVVCQPTHIMGGYEYEEMVEEIRQYQDYFDTLKVGVPLLNSVADYKEVITVLTKEFSLAADTALVLMGHGTAHRGNAVYAALDYYFKAHGYRNVFVGTVESYPDMQTVMDYVKESGYQKVLLAPFMVVAGDHALNDLAGEEDSWKTAFQDAGFQTEVRLKGLGEYEGIQALYCSHAADAVNEL